MRIRNLLCLFFLVLTGCGFHLRGMIDMPPWLDKVAIVVQNANRNLSPLLKDQLQAYNIKVVDNPTDASYLLILESDGIQQQLTNVGASTAPRQYLLIYNVRFTLVKVKGAALIPSTQVFTSRQFTSNNDRILGSNSEEMLLGSEMRRDVIMQIINRISRENRKMGT